MLYMYRLAYVIYNLYKYMKNKTTIAIVLIIFIAIVLAIWQKVGIKKTNETSKVLTDNKTMVNKDNSAVKNNANNTVANPANLFCNRIGGKTEVKKLANGGDYSLCNFNNGSACEVEALLKGDCSAGEVKTGGYDTDAKKYCVWTGGKLNNTKSDICTFKDESTCKADDLFAGICRMGQNPKAAKKQLK